MISTNILMSRLGETGFESKGTIRKHWFSRVVLAIGDEIPFNLSTHNSAGIREEMRSTLVCGDEKTTSFSFLSSPDTFILYVAKPDDDVPLWIAQSERCIVYRSEIDVSHIFRIIQRYLFEIDSWIFSLKDLLLENGTYQDLLDRSESILGNFITINNADFRFLAHTRHISIDDPALDYALKYGRHPQEMIDLFRKYRITQYWESQSQIEEKPASAMNRYPVLDFIFHMQGKYFIHVLMHCNNRPPSQALIDLFEILIDHISYLVKRDWHEGFSFEVGPSGFFSELIANTSYSRADFERRLKEAEIPAEGEFVLYVFNFTNDVSDKSLLAYYSRKLSEILPRCRIGIHGRQILLLDFKSAFTIQESASVYAYAEENPCLIGVSDAFTQITDFSSAFQQANYAVNGMRHAQRTLGRYYSDRDTPVFRYFSSAFCSYTAEAAWRSDELVRYTLGHGIVSSIAEYDRVHGTNDSKILFHYLAAERNASKASRMLYINRSTLVYRIETLQLRFNIDLDDFALRQRIITEYLLYPLPSPAASAGQSNPGIESRRMDGQVSS